MDLGEALETAIEARLAPRLALADRLRAAVDVWVTAERTAVTSRVTSEVLRTLGQAAAAATEAATEAQIAALADLRAAVEALGPPAGPTTKAVEPERPAPRKRAATLEEQERADRIVAEIATMDPGEHHLRLVPWMRWATAEVRLLMRPLAASSPTYERLFDALETIRQLRKRAGVKEFVFGIDLAKNANWESVASKERREVDRFDQDTQRKPRPPNLTLVVGR